MRYIVTKYRLSTYYNETDLGVANFDKLSMSQ